MTATRNGHDRGASALDDFRIRWSFTPGVCNFPAALTPELRRSLQARVDPLACSAGGTRLLARLIAPLRRFVKALIRPWLGYQAEFNQELVRALDALHRGVHSELTAILARQDERYQRLCNQVDAQGRWLHAAEIDVAILKSQSGQSRDAILNEELSHVGTIAKAGLWFNPPVVVVIRNGQPVIAAVTERIVEHIFVHTRLPRPPARVLDLGCAESTNAVEMASLGYEVVGVDLRPLPVAHPLLQMVVGDIANLPFPDASFDVAVSLSTIEHVGLDWYAPTPAGATDHKVIAEVKRVLRPGGRFILTIPFGKAHQTPVHRIYDRPMLDALLAPLHRVETSFAVREGDAWLFTTNAERAEQADSSSRVSAVALVVAEKHD